MTCEIAQDIWDDATERGQSALEAALLARTLTPLFGPQRMYLFAHSFHDIHTSFKPR
jgi:hypothetical protein